VTEWTHREQTGFTDPQCETHHDEPGRGRDRCSTRHDDPTSDDEDGEVPTRPQTFQDELGGDLQEKVEDEETGLCARVSVGGQSWDLEGNGRRERTRPALYCASVMLILSVRPATLALPTFPRSYARRYHVSQDVKRRLDGNGKTHHEGQQVREKVWRE
jgi:hypothetical protein